MVWPPPLVGSTDTRYLVEQICAQPGQYSWLVLNRKSLGGLQTDLACRVLDTTGKPIPGLFAAGETAGFGGGGSHGSGALEGTFLGGCILTGRIAGQTIPGGTS